VEGFNYGLRELVPVNASKLAESKTYGLRELAPVDGEKPPGS